MKRNTVFHRAGCPVCVSAEKQFVNASVPALAIDGQSFHINSGAAIADLR